MNRHTRTNAVVPHPKTSANVVKENPFNSQIVHPAPQEKPTPSKNSLKPGDAFQAPHKETTRAFANTLLNKTSKMRS